MKIKLLCVLMLCIFATSISYSQNYYLGTGNGTEALGTSCASCHKEGSVLFSPVYDKWKLTAHAIAQDSMKNPFFGYDCLKCHNTGWNEEIENYGADEYVIKDTTQTPNYVITDQTNWNRVKNVGCESCHGPLGDKNRSLSLDHWRKDINKPDLSAEVCGKCHQDVHHPYFEQWQESMHAKSTTSSAFIKNVVVKNKACVKCHVAQNFIAYIKNPSTYKDTILAAGDDIKPITCVACHDPHENKYSGQLRFPISSSKTICDECHTADIDTVDINTTPHHTTSEALSGSKLFGYQYEGHKYSNSAHTYAATKRCINCHLYMSPFNGVSANTAHTFEPRVEACRSCHEDYYTQVDTSNHAKRFDYKGVQTRIDSLITVLQDKLSRASSADSATTLFKEANYNLLAVQGEGSRGIHNTNLVQELLQDAIASFNPTAVKEEAEIPQTYNLSQNYPNPFNPVTVIKFSIPKSSNVRIIIYDAIGREVTTLVNGYYTPGNYKVEWNASKNASGIYFYKIDANDFNSVKKMVLIK